MVFQGDAYVFGLLQQATHSYFIDYACGRPGVMILKQIRQRGSHVVTSSELHLMLVQAFLEGVDLAVNSVVLFHAKDTQIIRSIF